MKKCILTFRSVTPAQRAEAFLQRAGVDCTLQRTPRWMEERGCGYSIKLDCGDLMTASAMLRQAGIPFRKAYSLRDNGTPEELRL